MRCPRAVGAANLTEPDLSGTKIRVRLGFMLDRGVSFAQAKRWLAGIDGLDACSLRPAQQIYAARLFHDGLTEPLPERLGVLAGERDLSAVPEITIGNGRSVGVHWSGAGTLGRRARACSRVAEARRGAGEAGRDQQRSWRRPLLG